MEIGIVECGINWVEVTLTDIGLSARSMATLVGAFKGDLISSNAPTTPLGTGNLKVVVGVEDISSFLSRLFSLLGEGGGVVSVSMSSKIASLVYGVRLKAPSKQ